MSIILKGIDIPKEGEWLEIIIKPTKELIIDTIRYSDNALLKTEYDSVIQIPKGHGRLIDGDELISDLRIYESKYCGEQGYITQDDIIDAPIILEAEEDE